MMTGQARNWPKKAPSGWGRRLQCPHDLIPGHAAALRHPIVQGFFGVWLLAELASSPGEPIAGSSPGLSRTVEVLP
jgi:hypothetical protein